MSGVSEKRGADHCRFQTNVTKCRNRKVQRPVIANDIYLLLINIYEY